LAMATAALVRSLAGRFRPFSAGGHARTAVNTAQRVQTDGIVNSPVADLEAPPERLRHLHDYVWSTAAEKWPDRTAMVSQHFIVLAIRVASLVGFK